MPKPADAVDRKPTAPGSAVAHGKTKGEKWREVAARLRTPPMLFILGVVVGCVIGAITDSKSTPAIVAGFAAVGVALVLIAAESSRDRPLIVGGGVAITGAAIGFSWMGPDVTVVARLVSAACIAAAVLVVFLVLLCERRESKGDGST